jgi:hypothetical protein
MKTWIGIDFSGANGSWSPGTKRSNVWVAVITQDTKSAIRLDRLERVQDFVRDIGLPPFSALAAFLKAGRFDCAAIDAPFSLPCEALPNGSRSELLKRIAALPIDTKRHIPRGAQLIDIARERLPRLEDRGTKSLYRSVERQFQATRTGLWNGPRGGAAFTIACLRLLAEARHVALWSGAANGQRPRIVEAYPAGQLRYWGLPHARYGGKDDIDIRNRAALVKALEERIQLNIGAPHRELMRESPDALDAVICAFGAKAAYTGNFVAPAGAAPKKEGWIAIHPPP